MPPLAPMGLHKLTIKAFKSRKRAAGDEIGTFEALYSPGSYSQKYEIQYGRRQGINSTNKALSYSHSKPREVGLKLILDGTGVHEPPASRVRKRATVSERVKEFIDLAFHMNGGIHEPNFLVAEWGGQEDGGLIFPCRLAVVDVSYTTFDRDGSPVRAELDITLISDEDVQKRLAKENKNSPDLTHRRIVRSGDTLPLLAKEIYGSAEYYLRVAQVNELDNFRNLTPGQELIFPPLEG